MMRNDSKPNSLPLEGLRVLDVSTLYAGPLIATHMGDFGADVLKIEHPRGDSLRRLGHQNKGVSLWWKTVSRNKRAITLNLSKVEGQGILKKLVETADVLIENFRPGTMERWNLGWDALREINPRLVMVRTTGFGQTGPYKDRPGFGTLAEAISGFAHITGSPDGPPTLPPFGLADSIAALYGVSAVMYALYERDANGGKIGQWLDLSIYEPIFSLIGNQPTVFDQLGTVQSRTGNRSINNAPRNTYLTADQQWVALSTASDSIAKRVLTLVGGEGFANDPRFSDGASRVKNVDEIDQKVAQWISRRTLEEVIRRFEEAEAAVAPVYGVDQIFADPHFRAREDIVTVADDELGEIKMQGVFPKMSRTPGHIRYAGQPKGSGNTSIYCGELGYSEEELALLKTRGVI